MVENIKNKVVVITGASSGMGAATARLLAQSGARVVLRFLDNLSKTRRQIIVL